MVDEHFFEHIFQMVDEAARFTCLTHRPYSHASTVKVASPAPPTTSSTLNKHTGTPSVLVGPHYDTTLTLNMHVNYMHR